MLRFLVRNQKIEITEREIIASDQIEFVSLKFTFDGAWKEFHKVVQFTQCDETFNIVLGVTGTTCTLPSELHAGAFKMSVFGYGFSDSVQTLRATTVPVTMNIRPSGFVGDEYGSEIPPTPDLYTQLIAKIEEMLKNHNCGGSGKDGLSAYELAVQNGFSGTLPQWLESLKGKDGADGRDGADGKDVRDGRDGKDGADGTNAAPCNCNSRIQQLEDRFIYEIHDIREEFEQSIHKHENINLLNQIQSDNIHTHS
ncbi:MAG: hypothetical protein MSH15_09975, partial [Oscillospiraceae bacterium]|nr:hypothetical protein [Oscillospiraceae bacterium]